MPDAVTFTPIGVVRTPFATHEGMPIQTVAAQGVRGPHRARSRLRRRPGRPRRLHAPAPDHAPAPHGRGLAARHALSRHERARHLRDALAQAPEPDRPLARAARAASTARCCTSRSSTCSTARRCWTSSPTCRRSTTARMLATAGSSSARRTSTRCAPTGASPSRDQSSRGVDRCDPLGMVVLGPVAAHAPARDAAQSRARRRVDQSQVDVAGDEHAGHARGEPVRPAEEAERSRARRSSAKLAEPGDVEHGHDEQHRAAR